MTEELQVTAQLVGVMPRGHPGIFLTAPLVWLRILLGLNQIANHYFTLWSPRIVHAISFHIQLDLTVIFMLVVFLSGLELQLILFCNQSKILMLKTSLIKFSKLIIGRRVSC